MAQTHFSGDALKAYVDGQDNAVTVSVAGRLVTIRDMGKSQFVKIFDQQGQIQLYVKKDVVGEEAYTAFKKLDLGDIIGVTGTLFKTKTGEVTVRVDRYTLVSKALRPLPFGTQRFAAVAPSGATASGDLADPTLLDGLITQGWTMEGEAATRVFACVPRQD